MVTRRCNHWEKLDEGNLGSLCSIFATSCESILISKNVKTNRNHMIFSDAYNSLINSNELSVN